MSLPCFSYDSCYRGVSRSFLGKPLTEASEEEFNQRLEFLETVPLFTKLEKKLLPRVARALAHKTLLAGDIIVKQGELPDPQAVFYLIEFGDAYIVVDRDGDGSLETRASLGIGDHFGGHSFMNGKPYEVSVVAGSCGVGLLSLSAKDFEELRLGTKLTFPKRRVFHDVEPSLQRIQSRKTVVSLKLTDAETQFAMDALHRNAVIKTLVSLSEDGLAEAVRHAKRHRYTPGQKVCSKGDVAQDIYVLYTGVVHLIPDEGAKDASTNDRQLGGTAKSERERRLRKQAFLEQLIAGGEDPFALPQKATDLNDPFSRSAQPPAAALRRLSSALNEETNFTANRTPIGSMGKRQSMSDEHPSTKFGRSLTMPEANQRVLRVGTHVQLASQGDGTEIGRVVRSMKNGQVMVYFPSRGTSVYRPDELAEPLSTPRSIAKKKITPGAVFGEMGLLYNIGRLYTCQVGEGGAEIFSISKNDFKKCVIHDGHHGKQLQEWQKLLEEVSCFSVLLQSEIEELAANVCGEIVYQPQERVVHAGSTCPFWYIIASGSAAVSDPQDAGCKELSVLTRANYFGEYALLKNGGVATLNVDAGDAGLVCICIQGEILKRLSLSIDPGDDQSSLDDYYVKKGLSLPPNSRDHSVNPICLQTTAVLGSGNFSTTYLQEDPITKKKYALKKTSKRRVRQTGVQKLIANERRLLEHVDSDFVNRFYASYQDSLYVYMLLEACLGGTVEDLIDSRGVISAEEARFFVYCTVLGLEHLHERWIAHRDIKPGNLLLDSSGYVKICDMGFARIVFDRAHSMLGTPEYMAPELLDFPNEHNHAVDWWALGVLTYELITGNVPWTAYTADDDHRCYAVRESQKSNPQPTRIFHPSFQETPKEALQFTAQMLSPDPKRRVASDGNRNSEWFCTMGDFNLKALQEQDLEAPYVPPAKNFKPYDPPEDADGHEGDDSFSPMNADQFECEGVDICGSEATMTMTNVSAKPGCAYAVSESDGVVRITVAGMRHCQGIVRVGLTADKQDNQDFEQGYYIGLMPHISRSLSKTHSYLVAGTSDDSITLAIEENQAVVYEAEKRICTLGRVLQSSLYAKIFIHGKMDTVPLTCFEEFEEDEDYKNWDENYRLPLALARLALAEGPSRQCSDGSSESSYTQSRTLEGKWATKSLPPNHGQGRSGALSDSVRHMVVPTRRAADAAAGEAPRFNSSVNAAAAVDASSAAVAAGQRSRGAATDDDKLEKRYESASGANDVCASDEPHGPGEDVHSEKSTVILSRTATAAEDHTTPSFDPKVMQKHAQVDSLSVPTADAICGSGCPLATSSSDLRSGVPDDGSTRVQNGGADLYSELRSLQKLLGEERAKRESAEQRAAAAEAQVEAWLKSIALEKCQASTTMSTASTIVPATEARPDASIGANGQVQATSSTTSTTVPALDIPANVVGEAPLSARQRPAMIVRASTTAARLEGSPAAPSATSPWLTSRGIASPPVSFQHQTPRLNIGALVADHSRQSPRMITPRRVVVSKAGSVAYRQTPPVSQFTSGQMSLGHAASLVVSRPAATDLNRPS